MTHNRAGSANKIQPLTSLRYFAAVFVVLFHTAPNTYKDLAGYMPHWLDMGFISVSFFFVLSGYILAVAYLKNDRPINKRRFWAARLARIYPLFMITLTLEIPHLIWDRVRHNHQSLHAAVAKTAVTYAAFAVGLQAWAMRLRGLNFPGWSLSVEAFFYLLFPWIGVALWRLGKRGSIVAAINIFALSMSLVYVARHIHIHSDTLRYNPLLHLGEFSLGILFAKLHIALTESHGRQLARASLPVTLAGAAILAYIILIPTPISNFYYNDGLLAPLFGTMIVALACGDNWITRVLSLPGLVLLGEASYALYLFHIPIWHVVEMTHLDHNHGIYVAYLLTCFAVSVGSFYLLEIPLREAVLRRAGTKSKESMLTASLSA